MATQMLTQLPDAMDIDSSPHRSRANPANINMLSTQPETPIAETPFDWERPPRLASYDNVSASQPAAPNQVPASSMPFGRPSYLSQLSPSMQDVLSQDPSMSQFHATPTVPMTLTQMARKFGDVMPAYSLSRFLSPLTISLLVPLIVEALHRSACR